MKTYLRLLILTLSICLLSVEACPASCTQSYLFKNSVLKSQQSEYAPFLLSQQSQDSTTVNNTGLLKLKSPYTAVFLSVIPGILVHGSGHFYAGKTKIGYWLLGAEAAGIGIMFLGAMGGYAASESGDTGAGENADFLALAGLLLFVGSWVYDVVDSPIAVQKHNQKLIQGKNTELKLQFKDKDLRVAFVYHF